MDSTLKLGEIISNSNNYFYNNNIEQNFTTQLLNNNNINNNTSIMDTLIQELTPTSTYKNVLNNSINNYTNNIYNNFSSNIINNNYEFSEYIQVCTENEIPELELVAKITPILTPIFFGIIAITGFIGNSLVILVVLLNTHMHSTTNLLIVNLAFADLLFVIFCIPFTAFDYMVYKWPFGLAWCQISQYLIIVSVSASVYTLVLMSIDRFLAIVFPVRSRAIRTEKLTKIAIIILWVTIIVLSLPVIPAHTLSKFSCNNVLWIHCNYSGDFLEGKYYFLIFFATAYFLPLILISVLYIKIVSRLWRRIGGAKMSAESQKGRRRVTRVVVVVVLAFALLWLPVQILLLWNAFNPMGEVKAVRIITLLGAQTLAYSSSCINPILYAFLSENFRKAFQKAIYFSSSYRFGTSKQYNDLSTTSTAAAAAARRRVSAVQDSVAVI